MKYKSTRGKVSGISFKDTVLMGLAEDGGLLLPERFPKIDVASLKGKSYQEVAFIIMREFATDIPDNDLKKIIDKSYSSFRLKEIMTCTGIQDCKVAELFHGPTYAFKDIALQVLGNLFEYVLAERGEKLNIVGATSGDTGSAAIHGVKGKENINIVILYPKGKVSAVQELQMTTVADENVHTLAVEGTFDDCQRIVKNMFGDAKYKSEHHLGAVNSINWARIMCQIVYYFYAYVRRGEPRVNFVVPTGNFGNIFAGYCAMRMGLPIDKLVIATNANDILHRFVKNGDYSIGTVKPTDSPSMDIQIASNFERFLYYLYGEDSAKVIGAMAELKETGRIKFSEDDMVQVRKIFASHAASDEETEAMIKRVYDHQCYLLDPHTACGVAAVYANKIEGNHTIVFATAHPAKFGDVVAKVLGDVAVEPEGLKALKGMKSVVTPIANDEALIKKRVAELVK